MVAWLGRRLAGALCTLVVAAALVGVASGDDAEGAHRLLPTLLSADRLAADYYTAADAAYEGVHPTL